jgi:hypothetical protein
VLASPVLRVAAASHNRLSHYYRTLFRPRRPDSLPLAVAAYRTKTRWCLLSQLPRQRPQWGPLGRGLRLPQCPLARVQAATLQDYQKVEALNRSQIATGSQKHRDPRFPPHGFTEHGAIMAATILNSPRAVEMSLYVVRAFVRLRELLASNTALARKLDELERKYRHHDEAITAILSAIRELTNPPAPKRRSIGFTADLTEKS